MIPLSRHVMSRLPSWLTAPAGAIRFAVENALGRRVIAWMLLCSFGLALLSSGVQLYVNYRRDVAQIERRLSEIERSSMSALTTSIWNLDIRQLRAELGDIVALPDVSAADFVDVHGMKVAEAGDRQAGAIVRVIRIWSPAGGSGRRVELGTLTIRASLAVICISMSPSREKSSSFEVIWLQR